MIVPDENRGIMSKLLEEYTYGELSMAKSPRPPNDTRISAIEHYYPLKTIRHVAKISRAIRDAVGDELEIGIGIHGPCGTAGAIRVASILEEFNPFRFKGPVCRKMWMRWPE